MFSPHTSTPCKIPFNFCILFLTPTTAHQAEPEPQHQLKYLRILFPFISFPEKSNKMMMIINNIIIISSVQKMFNRGKILVYYIQSSVRFSSLLCGLRYIHLHLWMVNHDMFFLLIYT